MECDSAPRIVEWDFRPYFPLRPINERGQFIRENVYVRRWQKMMTNHAVAAVFDRSLMKEDQWFLGNESWRYPILDIFGYIPSAHQTRIASNFILYMGLGAGASYIDHARKLSEPLAKAYKSKPDAYIAQWMLENNPSDRGSLTNNTPRYDFAQSAQQDFLYEPRYDDIQTLDRIAYWCGTDMGQSFISKCDLIIKAIEKRNYPPETTTRVQRRHKISGLLGLKL